jgi:gliding-associated putative ABC transporter substrate-binding component GldG
VTINFRKKLTVLIRDIAAQTRQNLSLLLMFNLLIIAILVTLLGNTLSWRIDLTANKIHSLSPATKKILKELNDIVVIKAFISENLPAPLIPLKNNLIWFLENYQKESNGKVRVIILDPSKDQKIENQAIRAGIPPLQFSTLEQDKFQVSKGYLGIVVSFGEKQQTISTIQDIPNLEYHLTSAIKKVTHQEQKTIAFSSGNGEIPLDQITIIRKAISQSYSNQTVNLSSESARFEKQVDAVVVDNPTKPFSKNGEIVLDQFIQKGKGVVILTDSFNVDTGMVINKVENGLTEFLSHYGFKIDKEIILDPQASLAAFRTQQGNFIIPYPLWPKISPQGFNKNIPATGALESLVLPWVSPININNDVNWLVKTSPKSALLTNPYLITPDQKFSTKPDTKGEKIVAAIRLKGTDSFFKDKKPDEATLKKLRIKKFSENSDNIKLAVVADADFIKDTHLRNNPENANFFLNLLDYLLQETDLLSIRGKPIINRPIRELSARQKQTVKVLNFLYPIVFLGSCYLILTRLRKKYD